jgi:molybdopterin-guanine dinucleotide biosynthesis protein A
MRYCSPVSTLDAIVPAGGTIDPEFASRVGTDQKALIQLGDSTVLESILRALRESGRIRNIVVVGSPEVRRRASDFGALGAESGNSGPDSIFHGLDELKKHVPNVDRALIVTGDLAYLSGDVINRFLDLCPADRDICVPVIEEEEFHAVYPGTSSTFVKTRDGTFTVGGVYLMNAHKMPDIRIAMERVFAKRKSKLGMAMLIGPVFILKFLTKSLEIRDIENKIQSMLNCTGAAVRGAPAQLAYDLDDLEDYDYAAKLEGKGR